VPAEADRDLVEAIADRLDGLAGDAEIVGPLGVGNHVDHQLARRALERARPDAALYEEFPYTEWKWFAVARALGRRRDWEPEVLALEPAEVEARLDAIAAYASQVPTLFRNPGRLRRQLRRALARTGGERLWRRRRGR
jgi:LmbE family N-acetylglucosaminyl deacetylase